MQVRNIVIFLALALLALAGVLWGSTYFWEDGGYGMSGHGWFAYILGGVFTLITSIALFFLVFFSARRGHDERAHPDDS